MGLNYPLRTLVRSTISQEKPQRASSIDRSNEAWLEELRGPDRDEAIADLRAFLVRGLRLSLANRINTNLDEMVEDFVQEALLKILDNLHTFRGESRFTTWAQKIAVNVALTDLRRRHWKDVSLQEMLEPYADLDFSSVLPDDQASPENRAARTDILEIIQRLIDEELTERQRQAILAVMVGGVPLEEVARRMDTNRNALYKLIHDARLRLKNLLLAQTGLSPQDVLMMFEEG